MSAIKSDAEYREEFKLVVYKAMHKADKLLGAVSEALQLAEPASMNEARLRAAEAYIDLVFQMLESCMGGPTARIGRDREIDGDFQRGYDAALQALSHFFETLKKTTDADERMEALDKVLSVRDQGLTGARPCCKMGAIE